MVETEFFLVWNPRGNNPSRRHQSHQSAKKRRDGWPSAIPAKSSSSYRQCRFPGASSP